MSKILQYLQEKVVFLPKKLKPEHRFSFQVDYEELLFETPKHGRINAIYFRAKQAKGIILYFHGNANNLERWGKIASEYVTFGYDVLVPDYRGYGKSSGERNEEALYADAQFCYDFAKKKFAEEKIVVYGRSLGGAFAVKVASENTPKLVILEATFYNLQDMASRWIPFAATEKISPKMSFHFLSNEYIKKIKSPLYHFHGSSDLVVPIKSGKKLFHEFKKHQPNTEKKFIEIKGGSHDNLSQYKEYQAELKEILN